MPRRIVLVGKGESLQRAWRSRSFGLAGADLERLLHVAGFALDDTYHPVRVAGRLGPPAERPAARGFRYARPGGGPIDSYAVRAIFDDEEAVHRLRRERGTDVVGVFADPVVSVFPSAYCGSAGVGTAADVARRLGVPALRARGLTGKTCMWPSWIPASTATASPWSVAGPPVRTTCQARPSPITARWWPTTSASPRRRPRSMTTRCCEPRRGRGRRSCRTLSPPSPISSNR